MKTKLLLHLMCIVLLSISLPANAGIYSGEAPNEAPLPSELVVVVPWTVDTLRIECASDIPPIIAPTVSSSCGMDDTTRTIITSFGACVNERTIERIWYY